MKENSPVVQSADVQPPDRVAKPNSFPLTFDQWLERPFMSYYQTTGQATGWKFGKSARLFQFNEKEIQNFTSTLKKKSGSKARRKTSKYLDRKALIDRIHSDDSFPEVFRRCQKGDDEMMMALGNQVIRHCEHLFLLAEEGNPVAAKYLAELAIKATKGTERIIGNHYEAMRSLAAIEYAWPMMASPVTSLSSPSPDWEKLGLGVALNEGLLNKNRRVNLDNPTGRLAWRLLNYVANLKYYYKALESTESKPRGGKLSIGQQVAALPGLTKDSLVISKWWEVAQQCLVASYPLSTDETKIDEKNAVFDGIVSAKDQRTPERHRNRIMERLSGEFDSIAGYERVKKA